MIINNKNVSLIIPTIARDIINIENNIELFFKYLPISKIVLIGNTDVSCTKLIYDYPVIFINENDIIPFSLVANLINIRYNGSNYNKRIGWYVQQLIKIGYARICTDEYYLLWDSDTIPLKYIDLYDENNLPYLDYKTEYYKPYFETMNILLGYNKIFKGSFIAEHMLINTKHMLELIELIENNNNIDGKLFYEKIINSIPIKHLQYSGFSEFETYGTFVLYNYPKEYTLRRWYSFRYGGFFWKNFQEITIPILSKLSKKYHAITFEKTHKLSWIKCFAVKNIMLCNSASVLEIYALFIRVLNCIKRKLKSN